MSNSNGYICDELAMTYRRYGAEGRKYSAGDKPENAAPSTAGFNHGVGSHKGKVSRQGGKRKFVPEYSPPPIKPAGESKAKIRSETNEMVAAYLSGGGRIKRM